MVGVLCGGFGADALCAAGCIAVYRDARDLLDHYEASRLAGGGPDQQLTRVVLCPSKRSVRREQT
jgi:hypothetical protein